MEALDLKTLGLKEIDQAELSEVEGGCFGFFLIALLVGAAFAYMAGRDN